jgi:hypothetical protein
MTATILQPDLDLKEYPNDKQNIVIAFESYGLTEGVMGLSFAENPISYITDKSDNIVFSKNPVSECFIYIYIYIYPCAFCTIYPPSLTHSLIHSFIYLSVVRFGIMTRVTTPLQCMRMTTHMCPNIRDSSRLWNSV